MAEEGGSLANNSTMSPTVPCEEDGDECEEVILVSCIFYRLDSGVILVSCIFYHLDSGVNYTV